MGKYKVKIYPVAQMDLNDIVDYLNTLSPQDAIRYYDRLLEKIGSVEEMPQRCPFVRDIALKAKGYRFLIVENHIVFLVIQDSTVQIRRILYNRRQYEWFL